MFLLPISYLSLLEIRLIPSCFLFHHPYSLIFKRLKLPLLFNFYLEQKSQILMYMSTSTLKNFKPHFSFSLSDELLCFREFCLELWRVWYTEWYDCVWCTEWWEVYDCVQSDQMCKTVWYNQWLDVYNCEVSDEIGSEMYISDEVFECEIKYGNSPKETTSTSKISLSFTSAFSSKWSVTEKYDKSELGSDKETHIFSWDISSGFISSQPCGSIIWPPKKERKTFILYFLWLMKLLWWVI